MHIETGASVNEENAEALGAAVACGFQALIGHAPGGNDFLGDGQQAQDRASITGFATRD
jgi:hypothetical protein